MARDAQVQKGQKVKHYASCPERRAACGISIADLKPDQLVADLAEFQALVQLDCGSDPARYVACCRCATALSGPTWTATRGALKPPPIGKGHLPEGLRAHLLDAAALAAERAHSLLCHAPGDPPPNIGEAAALLQAAADATKAATAFDVVPL